MAVGIEDLHGALGRGGFDALLCHNAIQYLPDPRQGITTLARPAEHRRVAVGDRAERGRRPLRAAVRSMVLKETRRLLDAPTRHAVTYGAQTRVCFAEGIAAELASARLRLLAHCASAASATSS